MLANKFAAATTVKRFMVYCLKDLITGACANKVHWQQTRSSPIAFGTMYHLAVIGGKK